MENVNMSVKGDKLVIEIDLKHRGEVSSSGKSIFVATTSGNADVPGADGMKIGINCYVPNKK